MSYIEYTVKVYSDGDTHWYLNGKLHREEGPAIGFASGTKYWWLNGERHREDGPAIELSNGTKEWWLNGQCHREDGPAIENANGAKFWYLNGKQLSEYEFNKQIAAKNATPSCEGKVVEIEGMKYKLIEIK